MHSFLYDYEENHKAELNQYLSDKRKDGNFKVLDVGGSVGHWFWDNTDVLFELLHPNTIGVNNISNKTIISIFREFDLIFFSIIIDLQDLCLGIGLIERLLSLVHLRLEASLGQSKVYHFDSASLKLYAFEN